MKSPGRVSAFTYSHDLRPVATATPEWSKMTTRGLFQKAGYVKTQGKVTVRREKLSESYTVQKET